MQEFLNRVYFGNTVLMYLTALAIFAAGIIIIKIFQKIVLYRLKKWSERTETKIDDFLIRGLESSVLPLVYYGILYFAVTTLEISPKVLNVLHILSSILITFFTIKLISSTFRFSFNNYIIRQDKGEEKQKEIKGITSIATFLIWGFGIVFLLSNLGYNVSAVITGLGIGGIAIALAAQAVLGDLFSYFVIFFDRPFEIGDFIIVDDKMGAVEYIGIKTTRLRSLGGEQLIFSNANLTASRIHNYKKMERRRVVFQLAVVYQTKAEVLKEIPLIVKRIIEIQKDIAFDRAHFASFSQSSLIFEFVYYVLSADYNKYMDIQQSINLMIYEEFEKRKINFAYPTQTLYLNKNSKDEEYKSRMIKEQG
ncbi:MAG TPA: mechanosensitive ion channel family protein [Ignavibacteriaceae bacterium]|nr:mechanosensitive ion channel family protein [Ignavibacteriaceae bacterium]